METLIGFGHYLVAYVFSMNVRLSVFYIGCTIVIAFLVWHLQGRPKSFTRWLLPKDVYGHRSNLLDFKLFLTNNLAGFLGIFGAVLFAPAVAYWVLEALTGGATSDAAPSFARSLAATVIIVMATDFCKYWAHRFHHEWKLLWPFHAVHHSADVLTPITVTRSHPVETLLRNLLITGIVGIVQAVVLWGLVGHVDLVTIGGANALTFAFNALGSNLRHSHIWLSYGPVLEHVFISPAQHQVHHSVAVEHHDKNYGSIFAIWDWMFGTLYVPRGRESLTFGVSDADGNKAEQPYPTLQAALLKPFRQSWEAARVRLERQGAPMGREMTPGFSLWLDVLRVLAAMTVLFGHMAHIRFTGGDYYVLREWNVASDAVIVFFVLSGVVIAFAAERDGTLERFSFNRLTRLWSVLVPALILTWVFDSIGTRVDMTAYPEGYYTERTAWEMFGRGLTFSNEWQGVFDRVRLGTNGPLWSLSYEAGFYALFGAALFLRGALRWVMLALIALVVGLPILALLPAWLLGVAVWHLGCHMPRLAAPRAWALCLLPVFFLLWLKGIGLDAMLTDVTIRWLAPMHQAAVLVYSDEVLWNSVIACAVALHLLGVRHLARTSDLGQSGPMASAIRWTAGASFSLYVVHYPTLHLMDATLPDNLPAYDLWLLALTVGISLLFAALFERPLRHFRNLVRPVWLALVSRLNTGHASPASS